VFFNWKKKYHMDCKFSQITLKIQCKSYQNTILEALRYGKMRPLSTIPGMRGGGIKENDGGGEFNYDIL
jgi:hypothetical protein